MNVIGIIQARTGSTRLPKKVVMDLAGKTVLEHAISRVAACNLIDTVLVATTVDSEDDEIIKICETNKVAFFRGSSEDVLDRYYRAAQSVAAEHIVRITSDCPLLDPCIVDEVIKLHLETESDYTTNTLKPTYPDGEDVEVFTFASIERAWKNAVLKSEREHVTPYIRKNPGLFKLSNLENDTDISEKRWTLDEKKDYKFIKEIYDGLYNKNSLFGIKEVLEFLRTYPELEALNSSIKRNEGYAKSLKEDRVTVKSSKQKE